MSNKSFQGAFITETKAKILENISNEQFGVSELASMMNLSRSSLLRKIKKETNLSASQFIRQVRLEKSKDLLEDTELTISEISYEVGFSNDSYFIKCFRELYGLSPGDARKKGFFEDSGTEAVNDREEVKEKEEEVTSSFLQKHKISLLIGSLILILVLAFLFSRNSNTSSDKIMDTNLAASKKSIAVLPFRNMSSDSSNLYFVNGLMESSLNNLQKIEDLRVISRTSVERYRNTQKTTSEIAEDLNVAYLVEGSGQRLDNQVLLNIQLIDVSNDSPIWAEQYKHEIVDIFALQNEIAKKIAIAVEAKVTPAEMEQIDKKPTENLLAYDLYLQGQESFNTNSQEGLEKSISLFQEAIEEDSQFALAYSQIAVAYYFLDLHKAEKEFTAIINNNADKALLYDSKSANSLIAKALYYMNIGDFRLAVPHLEKALEYNPNSSSVVQILSNLYSRAIPNTAKFLQYALKGIKLDIAANDSIAKSFIYLQLGNALIQTGFVDESQDYVSLAMDYYPGNEYGPYLSAFIQYAKDKDITRVKNELRREWQRDTTRMDILQDLSKFYYFAEQYDSAYYYYNKMVRVRTENNLNLYPQEDLKIGIAYEKMGFSEEAKSFYDSYTDYCENDKSIYQAASLALKNLNEGKIEMAIENLREFSQKSNMQYWVILFFEKDPLMKRLQKHPEYRPIVDKIYSRFWENHAQVKKTLANLDLI